MANRQVFPSSLFPLRGDLSAEAGATSVKVIGIQGIPVVINGSAGNPGTPQGPYALVFIAGVGWTPIPLNCSVLCNGVPVSDDYAFFSKGVDLAFLVNWTHGFAFFVFQNGVGVVGTGT